MLSVLINKSIQTDPILINDFSRLAPLISNKLNGNPVCLKPKCLNVAMAEQKHNEWISTSSDSSGDNIRPSVPSHLSNNSIHQFEESIVVNPASLVHFHNFAMPSPTLWRVTPQPQYYNLMYPVIYRNFSQAVLPQNLSLDCFHRPSQESQRSAHTASNSGAQPSMNGLRYWEKVATAPLKPGFNFSVMCYNVLAQALLETHPYLYRAHKKGDLKWNIRFNNLIAEIRFLSPDILCLQEVQESHLEKYFSALSQLGYQGLYKKRTGPRPDGCAIYYKSSIVTLIEHATVEYKQPNVRLLDRDNVAIIAKFAPKKYPNNQFLVATTHLLYNPKRQDVRVAQTQLLLTEIERFAFTPSKQYLPLIVTGDLNSTPDSEVYKFIAGGNLKYDQFFLPPRMRITDQCQHADLLPGREGNKLLAREEEEKLIELKHSGRECDSEGMNKDQMDGRLFASGTLTHNFHLESVYRHKYNGDMEGTTYQDKWVSVDYIFYSNRRQLVLLERYRLPTKSELGRTRIPNSILGSDHLSLMAKFQLEV